MPVQCGEPSRASQWMLTIRSRPPSETKAMRDSSRSRRSSVRVMRTRAPWRIKSRRSCLAILRVTFFSSRPHLEIAPGSLPPWPALMPIVMPRSERSGTRASRALALYVIHPPLDSSRPTTRGPWIAPRPTGKTRTGIHHQAHAPPRVLRDPDRPHGTALTLHGMITLPPGRREVQHQALRFAQPRAHDATRAGDPDPQRRLLATAIHSNGVDAGRSVRRARTRGSQRGGKQIPGR